MTLDDEELQSQLAAEYVLGTLQGLARRRLEKILPTHAGLREKVAYWQQQLAPWASSMTPQTVPDAVWATIQARLHHSRKPDSRASLWKGWAFVSTALAASLVVMLARSPEPVAISRDAMRDVAVLSSEGSQTQWIVRHAAAHELQLTALGDTRLPPDKSLQLWAIEASGTPYSLGVLRLEHGRAQVLLSAEQQSHFNHATVLAISLETAGGSTSAVPQGPVIFTGKPVSHGV